MTFGHFSGLLAKSLYSDKPDAFWPLVLNMCPCPLLQAGRVNSVAESVMVKPL